MRATGVRHLVTENGRRKPVMALLAECPDLGHVLGLDEADGLDARIASWAEIRALDSEQPPAVPVGALDTSYIMHTSGSTGEPKLIRHTHASALAFAEWAADEYGLSAEDRLSNHSSHHTCFATFDYYAAARAAATTVVLTPAAMLMPASLASLVAEERISVWYSVPTALVQLLLRGNLADQALDALRWVLFAGETFPEKHLQALRRQLPGARFSHVYGSTEVNVCTYFHLPDGDELPAPLPIGRPCSNARSLVVDEDGVALGPGEPGELLIHGSTVMTGYWGDPDRNAEALVERPEPGDFTSTWFRTGDRVMTLDDGNLVFAGRADRQIKVRGFRVELEEVENALLALAPVLEAATWAVPDGEGSSAIRAAVVCDPGVTTDRKALLGALKERLPLYALPAALHVVDAMPRTPTGKVDRRQLAASLDEAAVEATVGDVPRTAGAD